MEREGKIMEIDMEGLYGWVEEGEEGEVGGKGMGVGDGEKGGVVGGGRYEGGEGKRRGD